MSDELPVENRSVPVRGLGLSLVALVVPVLSTLAFPDRLGQAGPLLWLLALVPAFLLAYYRGWRGAATALALGMAVLSVTQAVAVMLSLGIPDLLFWVVVLYLGIAVGIGWVTELLHRQRAQVENLALTDILTRLPNRRHARAFLLNEFGAAERGRPLCVVLFDLDNFKAYNDKWGHQAGDEALRGFAEILLSTTRRMNLSSRFGGEEFLSILAGSEVEGALTFADRVREQLGRMALSNGPLTVSAGIAAYHPTMKSPDELVAAADLALYRAKAEGRNQVRVFGQPAARSPEGDEGDVPTDGSPAASATGYAPGGGPSGDPDGEPRSATRLGSDDPGSGVGERRGGFGDGRRVLVVEDDTGIRNMVVRYLEGEGFQVKEARDTLEGRSALVTEFDVLMTDIRFHGPPGTELIAVTKARWPRTQVVAITGLRDAHIAAQALKAGADSYMFKPFGLPELQARLVDCLARRDRDMERASLERDLSPEAEARSAKARSAAVAGARALVRAMEARDPYTRGHSRRVGEYAVVLADVLAVDPQEVNRDELRLACEFHDLGKLGVPDRILNRAEPLTPEEMDEVRKHPRAGRQILEPLFPGALIRSVAAWHHERWDGEGYPDGLPGEVIPLPARIVAVADALDAMTSDRAHRPFLPWDDAVSELRREAGTRFDPGVIEALNEALPALRRIHDASVAPSVTPETAAHGPPSPGPGPDLT
jgi:putative two-component system response regulator